MAGFCQRILNNKIIKSIELDSNTIAIFVEFSSLMNYSIVSS